MYNVNSGQSYTYSIGKGGDFDKKRNITKRDAESTWFDGITKILAVAGSKTSDYVGGLNRQGLSRSSDLNSFPVGAVQTYGGNGGASNGTRTGGGGSSGGDTNGNPGNPTDQSGGAAPINGYKGGDGTNESYVEGKPGGIGAGGSGAVKGNGTDNWAGGAGGNGQIRITYDLPAMPSVTVNSITATSAVITWTGTESYIVEYGPAGFTPGTAGTAGTNGTIAPYTVVSPYTYTLTGLDSNKSYDVYIRQVCITTTTSYSPNSVKVNFKTDVAPCTGTPLPGAASLSPATGYPSSNFTATGTVVTVDLGITYQWQIGETSAGPFTNIPSATGSSANLRSIATPSVSRWYRRVTTCTNSGLSSTTTPVEFVNSAKKNYCSGVIATPSTLYIDSFKFVGTLNDPAPNQYTGGTGFTDYTGLTPIAMQPQGSVINVAAKAATGASNPTNGGPAAKGNWKAWVDWNGDGTFTAATRNASGVVTNIGEEVYWLTDFVTEALTFGFVIPQNQPPGQYRLRIRVGIQDKTSNFQTCENSSVGETEDYIFEVIADCSAKVNTVTLKNGERCGPGSVALSAAPTGTGTGIRWYAAATGGAPLASTLIFNTPSISVNTTYYVVAFSGNCESAYRIPVVAIVNPATIVSFGTVPILCEATPSGKLVTATGDKYVDILVNETFDSGFGAFSQSTPEVIGNYTGAPGKWINRLSPFIPQKPPYQGLSPALSSGYFGGNFAAIVTDIGERGPIMDYLTLTTEQSLVDFENLTLEFDLYYFGITNDITKGYFQVEYTLDGSNWITVNDVNPFSQKYITNQGNPNVWKKISIPILTAPSTSTKFKVRFTVYSYAKPSPNQEFIESIAAIDNVKIYGNKHLNSGFNWSVPGYTDILYKKDCITPLEFSDKVNTICVKPTPGQIENYSQFNLRAESSFTNGCPAIGNTIMKNDAKIYKTTASTDWNISGNWLPNDNLVPDITKCVTIKQPVILNLGAEGFAKNVTVETGGSLQIMKPRTLTINEYIINNAGQDKVLLESDANLIQQKSSSVNVGPLTAKRALTGLRNNPTYIDYVYWSSPVAGQLTKGGAPGAFSPGTPPSSFFSYRESNDQFYETADLEFIPGKGYAVEAEVGVSAKTYTFKGVPNNGNKSINIKRSANSIEGSPPVTYIHGYNLVGNPYPSNISFDKLYDGNSSLIYKTAWFWTNNKIYTPQQMGSQYEGNNYAIYNATGGNSAAYTVSTGSTYSEGFIKVGQAFIVQNKQQENTNDNLIFTNDMRVSDPGQFFSKGTAEKNRFWLTLTNPANVVNSQLIGYMDGASDGFEQDFDAESFGDYSDLFYSKLDDMKLVIHGRNQNFKISDKVNLGAVISQNGIYTISLNEAEGIFGKTQKIYLKDKIAGVVTDLTTNDYSFTTTKGISEGRFEIIYQIDAVLGTDEVHKENIVVYHEANTFGIKANQKILEVEMYDYAGRLLAKLQPLSTSSKIPADSLPNGIYLLQIKLANGDTITKKIRK